MSPGAAVVEAQGLGKDYGELTAVRSLDLTLAEGEIFGFLGPNGAGKTTAISMMCGVVTPSRGRAVIAGHDMGADPFAAKRALGLVPQDLALYEEITARQNLAFFGGLYGLRGAALEKRIDVVLEVAGLQERSREPVEQFSGGMKRRLNLAVGLVHEPRLLVLDEPTVGVDPHSRNHIFETIRHLQAEQGMTVLYTSHYMEEVQVLCDRVAILDKGELIANDRVDELIAAHASGALEIDLAAGADGEAAVAAAAAHGEATLKGKVVHVVPSGAIGPVITAVEASGAQVASVRSMQSDLETVFLTLTGHHLRDGT